MAAAAVQRDVMDMFYGPQAEGINLTKPMASTPYKVLKSKPQKKIFEDKQKEILKMFDPLKNEDFVLARNNFRGRLHAWKMVLLPNQEDIYEFRRAHKRKFIEVIKKEQESLGNIKVTFALRQEFTREKSTYNAKGLPETKIERMKHYFQSNQPAIFMRGDSEKRIEQKFDDFIEQVKGETDNYSEGETGWDAGEIDLAYIELALYQPLRGGTYIHCQQVWQKRRP